MPWVPSIIALLILLSASAAAMAMPSFARPSDPPRPEHPRPDFHRGRRHGVDWLNLNGLWRFQFDPEDVGEREQWFTRDDFAEEILVPFCWESPLAWGEGERAGNDVWYSTRVYLEPDKVTRENYRDAPRHQIGWYVRHFEVPPGWRDGDAAKRRIVLHFCAADWETAVWVNGEFMGRHEGGYTPFEFDVTDALAEGRNRLTVRVFDPQDHSRQPVGKQSNWYTRTSGIWQTVYLEPRGASYIKKLHITPDVDAQAAHLEVEVAGPGKPTGLRVLVATPDGRATEYHIAGLKSGLMISDPALWEPESPNLYEVTVSLLGSGGGTEAAEPLDMVDTYFGMRKVERRKLPGAEYEYVWLNDHPVYLCGALDQSFNPWGIYTFPTDEMIRSDIQRAKDFGFNFLRLHIKIDEPRLLYWADRLGVLLMCDMPNWGHSGLSPAAKERWLRMLRAAIARDYNHPSIIAWCLFNETWGLGGNDYKGDAEMQAWVKAAYELAKGLDPTRLVEDNSANRRDHVATDINSWHFYINDYAKARARIREVVDNTFPGSEFNFAPGHRQGTQPLMNSEYGGIGARAGDRDVSWCFRFLTNELRLHEKICGYVYTEHMDIEWEHNGFMNYDRTVKEFGYDVRDLNALDFVAIDHPPAKVYAPGQQFRADVFSSHFSPDPVEDAVLKWRLEVLGPTGERSVPMQMTRPIAFPQYRVTKVQTIEFEVPDRRGLAQLVVEVQDVSGQRLARNVLDFEIFPGELPPTQQTEPGGWVLRFHPASYIRADWNLEVSPTAEGDGHREIVAGREVGFFDYVVQLPEQIEASDVRDIGVCAELSAARPGVSQTDPDKHPSEVTISINGIPIAAERLENDPCDARGALSYIHGLSGEYGYLISASTGKRTQEVIASAPREGLLIVRLEVKAGAKHRGGLTVYGGRAGRYPTDPYVSIATR